MVPAGVRGNICNKTVTTAVTAEVQSAVLNGNPGANTVEIQCNFTYGSGGTSATVYIQTSLDGGVTWIDIACFSFLTTSLRKLSAVVALPATPFTANTTATDGSLANNTVLNGIIGDRFRSKVTTVGTYAGGTILAVDIVVKG